MPAKTGEMHRRISGENPEGICKRCSACITESNIAINPGGFLDESLKKFLETLLR